MPTPEQLAIKTLGPATRPSPLKLSTVAHDNVADFVPDDARVLLNAELRKGEAVDGARAFEKAGPRERIFFDPATTRAGIVTCGGLCPGLNGVIRSLVLELFHHYGVSTILGYRYGYQGLTKDQGLTPILLDVATVRGIHKLGGSILGCSRGAQPVERMVDTLVADGINILFALGGDGTLKGAHAIQQEIERRGLTISVIGVPKTIDNDVAWVDKTFGFETAVEIAKTAIDAAHVEASSALCGIGLVKLMGRDSGFVAAAATLASLDVNFCLVPELSFDLEGDQGLFAALRDRLRLRDHAVIVVAEGCAQSMTNVTPERDASGNVRYANADMDIGLYLKDAILRHFKAIKAPISLKYIDPSYMIRSCAANAADSIFCDTLGRQAVHAGMAGKTDLVIGRWNGVFTHLPLPLATSHRKKIDTDGSFWLEVMEATGQPALTGPKLVR